MAKPYASERLRRVTRFSGYMARAVMAALGLCVGLMAYVAFGDPKLILSHLWLVNTGYAVSTLALQTQVAIFAAMVIGSLPYLWGMAELRRMFVLFSAGSILTPDAAGRFRAFAVALTLGVLSQPVGSTLVSLALSFDPSATTKFWALSFGSESIVTLMLGTTMIVISWVFGEAVAVMDENRAFV
jgi:Protein of unknown function (DUF2975)